MYYRPLSTSLYYRDIGAYTLSFATDSSIRFVFKTSMSNQKPLASEDGFSVLDLVESLC